MDKFWVRALLLAGLVVMIRPQVGILMIVCLFAYLLLNKA